jgi:hypothetical protein
MIQEEQIEEILVEAHSMGFREKLLERVNIILSEGSTKRKVDIYEDEFQKIISEIID